MQNLIERAAQAIRRSRKTIALTGAGISAESGIPTFRDPGGLWDRYDPEEYATIQAYADRFGTLSDDEAQSLIKNWLDVDIAAAQLRAKYLPIVSKAIGGRKGATFAQLDRRIASLVDLQLGSKIPLVQSQ